MDRLLLSLLGIDGPMGVWAVPGYDASERVNRRSLTFHAWSRPGQMTMCMTNSALTVTSRIQPLVVGAVGIERVCVDRVRLMRRIASCAAADRLDHGITLRVDHEALDFVPCAAVYGRPWRAPTDSVCAGLR